MYSYCSPSGFTLGSDMYPSTTTEPPSRTSNWPVASSIRTSNSMGAEPRMVARYRRTLLNSTGTRMVSPVVLSGESPTLSMVSE